MHFAKIVSSPAFAATLRICLGLIFLLAATTKLFDPVYFFASILRFDFFDANFLWIVSLILPYIELLLALCLLSGYLLFPASLLGIWLLLLFSVVLSLARIQGIDVDCGCFGPLPIFSSFSSQIARNVLMTAALGFLAYKNFPRILSQKSSPQNPEK